MTKEAIAALEELGFSTYEARAYLALLQKSPVTGYQLSKHSGIPRSRIYETLERLVAKGYAVVLQAEPTEYAPLPADGLFSQLKSQFGNALSVLETEIEKLATTSQPESIWTLQGRTTILNRSRKMVARARESVYLVAWAQTIREVQAELEAAAARAVHIVVVSCGEIDLPLGVHYPHAFQEHLVCSGDSSINLVVDDAEVLIGETMPMDACRAAWSRNEGLILITEEYVRHEVYLHEIIERLGTAEADTLRKAFAEGLAHVPHRR